MDKRFHLKNCDTEMAFLYCHLESRRQFKVREEENERDGSFYVWAHVPVARKKAPLTFVRKDTVETPSHLSCYPRLGWR